jgi:chemotaxis protein CheX
LEINLRDAVKEVLGTTLSASPEYIAPEATAKGMSAIIGISDGMSGFLAVHMSPGSACTIAGTMLGDSYPEVDDIVCDALGELANMFGGSLKKFASNPGELFKISVPTIVNGKDYETHAAKDAKQALFGVKSDQVCFTMQLVIYSQE